VRASRCEPAKLARTEVSSGCVERRQTTITSIGPHLWAKSNERRSSASALIDQRSHPGREAAESARHCSSRRGSGAGPPASDRVERRCLSKQQPGVSAAARSIAHSRGARGFRTSHAGSGGTLESSPGAGPSIDSMTASGGLVNECKRRSRCSSSSRRTCCSRRRRWRSARARKSPYRRRRSSE